MLDQRYQPSTAWLKLGDGFSDPVSPALFPKHILRYRNQAMAEELGFGQISDEQWMRYFALFDPLPQNLPQPLALRYHGHQFTHYNPELGDGRGFLYGQLHHPSTQKLLDFGTKGSGQTPYSRRGDGRLTLKGAVREALATSYLQSKGVNTSKTWSIVETGEELLRHDEPSPTRSAVLVRLSHSHIRFGTFQRLAFLKDKKGIEELVEYCLKHHYPNNDVESFFNEVCRNSAKTTAQWMIHGFVHGVLNTDNMNITGESFDYGPYRFLPYYDTQFTAAYFDHQSLYAYGQQPQMVLWNLQRLQEALSFAFPFLDQDKRGLETFSQEFNLQTLRLFAEKLGLNSHSNPQKLQNLFYLCLQFLEKSKAPYEAFFNDLACWHQNLDQPLFKYNVDLYQDDLIDEIQQELGHLKRNHHSKVFFRDRLETLLIEEIENIWHRIETDDDWNPFRLKIERLNMK